MVERIGSHIRAAPINKHASAKSMPRSSAIIKSSSRPTHQLTPDNEKNMRPASNQSQITNDMTKPTDTSANYCKSRTVRPGQGV
ncbi:hypothetical protein T4B_5683 [Trichinella pseudospiralis]|uniref:Uncharacterized protein n=2 Tax=Trichinella pseudospiralis TaxID=6337 RepID=A0A0V1IRS4_TRIPS|nr:hypothetical protein T4D_10615 [Trichinella pseudospiralis]KRZ25425.1 hypothetical protein T4B_5683 [Trichinella pseudospiralis]